MRPTDPNITDAEWVEYRRRTAPVENVGNLLPAEADDQLWRIANLYTIADENGQEVHFLPNPEQAAILICIVMRGWLRIVIPKARQLGMSTLLSIIMIDGQVFNSGFQGALIDKTSPDAEKKMREKIQFAWDKLPPSLRGVLVEVKRPTDQLTIRGKGKDEVESSSYAAINFRGGTVSFLWISEWGWVQDNDRPRSLAIATGALPAIERAEKGLCVVETTWSGGLDGDLGPIVKEAIGTQEIEKGSKSWRVLFFGWHTCPLYVRSYGRIDTESAEYFAKLEALTPPVILTEQQKFWYAEKRRTAKSLRKFREEYPSVVEECWESVPEGSIYGEYIARSRSEGRIKDFLPDMRIPVDTFWDCGLPINTVAWFVQTTPEAIYVIDCLMEQDITMEDRAAWMNAKPYRLRHHFFPHETGNTQSEGLSQVATFEKILGKGCRVVPCVRPTVMHGVEMLQSLFPRLIFHKTNCEKALEMLGRYRAERESSTGVTKIEPIHDRYSHGADALRQLPQALEARMVPNGHIIGAVAAQAHDVVPRAILAGAPRAIRSMIAGGRR